MERKKNRGTFVAVPGIEEAKALFEPRRKLEHAILEPVMDRATTEQLETLEALTLEEE